MIINNWFIVVMYLGDMFSFRIFGYGLRFDRMQPTFVRRMWEISDKTGIPFNREYISIGRWDVEFLYPTRAFKTFKTLVAINFSQKQK